MPELTLIADRENQPGKVCDLIEKSNFFSDLDRDEMEMLAFWMKAYTAPAGTLILKEGEKSSSCLCIIVEGTVNIFKLTEPNDDHVKIAEIEAGASIGEMSVIDGLPLSASAISLTDATILLMPREDFNNLMKKNSNLGIKILFRVAKLISVRLRTTTGRLADLLAAGDK